MAPTKTVLSKVSSENVQNKVKNNMFGSSTSLPAIKNMSDYYNSAASDSSVFDGNDSAVASSLDIELDANGQPIFDNISACGENSAPIANDYSSDSGVPLKSKKLKREVVKKKSGFQKVSNKHDSESDYSSGDEDV